MKRKRVVILWGASGAFGDDGSGKYTKYKQALQLIEEGARLYGFEPFLVLYPGHPDREGITAGRLSFASAQQRVLLECERIEPDWIIGRSFGASQALASLSCGLDWVKKCRGAVIWGLPIGKYVNAMWPTPEDRDKTIEEYRGFGTDLVADFFDTLPEVESLAPTAACHLRFLRGSKDGYNSLEDLNALGQIHAETQPAFRREVIELEGFDHTPLPEILRQ
jgi:hypothetical protein